MCPGDSGGVMMVDRADTVSAEIRDTPARWTRLQIVVVAICTFINALDGMDVLIISYVAPAMAREWNVGFEALGVVFSAGLAGMMLGSIVIAPVADGLGRRPVILSALVLITIGTLGTGLVSSLPAFVGFRLVTGLGIGTLLASIAALASEYAPPGKRSIARSARSRPGIRPGRC